MAPPLETQFARIERLPPYVFSITSELKMAARRRGEDIIDFGMGNPDGPTPQHIVDKLVETVQRPDTHGYSVSKGIPRLRRAICHWYKRRWGVEFDPDTEAIVTIGSKEGIAHAAAARTSSTSAWAIPTARRRSTSSTSWSKPSSAPTRTGTRCRRASRGCAARSATGTSAAGASSSIPIRKRSSPSGRRRASRIWRWPRSAAATRCWCPTPAIRSTSTDP